MSHAHHDDKQPKTRSFFFAVFLSYWLLGITMGYLSQYIFLEEGIKRVFANLTAPLIADWLYSSPSAATFGKADAKASETEGSPRAPVTVALVTDDDLAAYHATYPLPYGFHAERLDSIAAHKPKAIFIDIAFLDARDDQTLGSLIDVLCGIRKQQGVPVFLASLDYAGQVLRPELEKAAEDHCFEKVAVPRQLDRYDRHNWEYVLQWNNGSAQSDSPALAIYKALQMESASLAQQAQPANLGILWGLEPHPSNPNRMRREDGTPLCRKEWRWLREIPVISTYIADPWFADDYSKRRDKPFCPYNASFPVHFLSSQREAVDELIHDRIVMYGVDLQSVGDYSFSPLHGAIPGVFVHAMALDNLLAFKGDYPRALDFQLSAPSWAGVWFPVGMVTLAALFAVLFHYLRHRYGGRFENMLAGAKSHVTSPQNTLKATESSLANAVILSTREFPQGTGTRLKRMLSLVALDLWSIFKLLPLIPLKWAIYASILFIVGSIGINHFHLGMLSWLEYALIPMLLETLHMGDSFAQYLHGLYRAGFDAQWAAQHGLNDFVIPSQSSQPNQRDAS